MSLPPDDEPGDDCIANMTATISWMVKNLNFANDLRQDFDNLLRKLCKKRHYFEKLFKLDTAHLWSSSKHCSWNNAASMQRVYQRIIKAVIANDIPEFTESAKREMQEWSDQISARMAQHYEEQKVYFSQLQKVKELQQITVVCSSDVPQSSANQDDSVDSETYSECMSPISQAPLEIDEFEDPDDDGGASTSDDQEKQENESTVTQSICWHSIFPHGREHKVRPEQIKVLLELNLDVELDDLVMIIKLAKTCTSEADLNELRKFIGKTIDHFNARDSLPNECSYPVCNAEWRQVYEMLDACIYRVVMNRSKNVYPKTEWRTMDCQLKERDLCVFHGMLTAYIDNAMGVTREDNEASPVIDMADPVSEEQEPSDTEESDESVSNLDQQQLSPSLIESVARAFQNVEIELEPPASVTSVNQTEQCSPIIDIERLETPETEQHSVQVTLSRPTPVFLSEASEDRIQPSPKPVESHPQPSSSVFATVTSLVSQNCPPQQLLTVPTSSILRKPNAEPPRNTFSVASTVALSKSPEDRPRQPTSQPPSGNGETVAHVGQAPQIRSPGPQPVSRRKRIVQSSDGPPPKYGNTLTVPAVQTPALPPVVQRLQPTMVRPILPRARAEPVQATYRGVGRPPKPTQQQQPQSIASSQVQLPMNQPPRLSQEQLTRLQLEYNNRLQQQQNSLPNMYNTMLTANNFAQNQQIPAPPRPMPPPTAIPNGFPRMPNLPQMPNQLQMSNQLQMPAQLQIPNNLQLPPNLTPQQQFAWQFANLSPAQQEIIIQNAKLQHQLQQNQQSATVPPPVLQNNLLPTVSPQVAQPPASLPNMMPILEQQMPMPNLADVQFLDIQGKHEYIRQQRELFVRRNAENQIISPVVQEYLRQKFPFPNFFNRPV